MNHIIRSRDRARGLSILLIALMTAFSAFTFQATVAWADEPPPDTSAPADTAPADTESTTDDTSGGGDGTGEGGDGEGTGGSNEAGNGTDSTGGSAAAGGGTASADDADTATSSNTATNDTDETDDIPTDAGPGSTTSTNSVQDDTTGTTPETGAPSSTSSTVTPANPETPNQANPETPNVPTGSANAGINTGDATAIGNMSHTEIVQIVIAIVNITMPNVNAADIVGPLVTINQNAQVTNAGMASAITGGNTAVASLISTVAGGGSISAQQLAGLTTTGTAGVDAGNASAVGNLSWTEVMQIASVITSINGDSSLTQQLTAIQQNASVTNAGSAVADSGGNNASVSVAVGTGGGNEDPGDESAVASNWPPYGEPGEDSNEPNAHRRILLWGPAPSDNAEVWIFVDGRQCKAAHIEEAYDLPGAYDWWAQVSPGECGAKNGSKMTFLVGARMDESVTFDNNKRASPQITFQALIQTDLAAKGTRR
jgi:hypothetical protein